MDHSASTTLSGNPASAGPHDRAVGLWLLLCALMVLAMAVIGAVTRLTESGLSIMEWAPISGALPPLSQAEWQRLFAIYQQIPEYQELNAGMSLQSLQDLLGHSCIEMTRRYARLTDNTRKEEYYRAMEIIVRGEINGNYRFDHQLP